jgi:hypothetical protein
MKLMGCLVLAAAMLAVMVVGICGCAHNSETSTTAPSNASAGSRNYSSDDLNRTGKRTPSEQLQAADPSVTAQGGR